MMCLAPLILMGAAYTIQTDWHHSATFNPYYMQAQTCKDGLGAHIKVGAEPFITGGIHYGFTWSITDALDLTLQPQAGLSYSNTMHPASHIRQITKFEAGLAVMLTVKGQYVISLEYTHMSNGRGYDPTNAGVDLAGLQVGYRFGGK